MISGYLLISLATLYVYVGVKLNEKSKRLDARDHTLKVRRRVLARRRLQARARQYELDCRHLTLLAAERIHNDNATALAAHVRFQMQRGSGRVEVA